MADLTAGGVPVSRDSAGVLREQIVSAGDSATAMLSPTEFTPEQAAMARLPLPFRNLIRDPFVPGISAAGVTTAYPTDLLQWMADKGVSSFRIINPNACYIRFRGATGTGDVIKEGEGRLMAPGAVECFSTQNPTFLSVMAVARPSFPIPADLVPVELNYGIGG